MLAAAGSWEYLDGEAIMAGVDLVSLPPVRLCSLIWSRVRAHSDEDEWRKFVVKVTRPLPGRKASDRLKAFRKAALA